MTTQQTLLEISTDKKRDISWVSTAILPEEWPLSSNFILDDDLLVSTFGKPGGLVSIKRGHNPVMRVLDRLNSSGMWINHCSFIRSILCNQMILHIHTREGVHSLANHSYKHIHDVRTQFGQLILVSTGTNEVVQIDIEGNLIHRWKFPGEGDAWHLNCLDLWSGRYVVSCFGRFEHSRQFKEHSKGAGLVFDLETEAVLWEGLTFPHTPRMDSNGRQYICDSGTHRVLRRDADGSNQREVQFPGFSRGMAFGRSHIYVGLSQMRANTSPGETDIPNAKIAVLDAATFEKVTEIDLPCQEIYDIVVMPNEIPL